MAAPTAWPATTLPDTAAATWPATATPARTAAAPQLPEQVAPLTIYYIALDGGGTAGPAIGCGDTAVATFTAPERFRDQVGPTMTRLLADHRPSVGQSGLYNALYQSDLAYEGGFFDGSTITVNLSGTLHLRGACDAPRAKAQLEYTAMTAAGAGRAEIYVNGRRLDDVLSLK